MCKSEAKIFKRGKPLLVGELPDFSWGGGQEGASLQTSAPLTPDPSSAHTQKFWGLGAGQQERQKRQIAP